MDLAKVDPIVATVKDAIAEKLSQLEAEFQADVIFFYGEIHPSMTILYRNLIEEIKIKNKSANKRLVIFLNTPGGSVETVETYVDINRYFYDEVYFVVPDLAMSAGTVFCMSGDKIYMDYSSFLGPIDPQVFNGERYVPALGYLDKIREYVDNANNGIPLNQVDLFFLQRQDIAFLQQCEQQHALTVDLIKDWLVKYKFKNWDKHSDGRAVSQEEKIERATKIATDLGNHKQWRSHGRRIGVKKLQQIGLVIEDYSKNAPLSSLIRDYNNLLLAYIRNNKIIFFLNSRFYF